METDYQSILEVIGQEIKEANYKETETEE